MQKMSRINIEIPDDLHQKLRAESAVENVPIKLLVIKAIRDHTESTELDVDPELLS